MLSGKMWHSVARNAPSLPVTAVQPTNLPAARAFIVAGALRVMATESGNSKVVVPPFSTSTDSAPGSTFVTVPAKRVMPCKGLEGV
jgi:hypothetical protein